MPSVNPDDMPADIREVIDRLVTDHTDDPRALAIAAWNASCRYDQGERLDPPQQ